MHSGFSHEQKPSTLWLQGQSLVMLSLVLDEHREDTGCLSCHFNPMERQKLLRAKDLLLADLTQAPGVAELARESGLSVLKIKRGVPRSVQQQRLWSVSGRTHAGSQKTPGQWQYLGHDGGSRSGLCQRQPFLCRLPETVWCYPFDL